MEPRAGGTRPSNPTGNSIVLEGTASAKAWRQGPKGLGQHRGAGKSDPRCLRQVSRASEPSLAPHPNTPGSPEGSKQRGPGLAARGQWTRRNSRGRQALGRSLQDGGPGSRLSRHRGDSLEGAFLCPPHRPPRGAPRRAEGGRREWVLDSGERGAWGRGCWGGARPGCCPGHVSPIGHSFVPTGGWMQR